MSFTLTLVSDNVIPAGRKRSYTAALTNGTAWTNATQSKTAPFTLSGIPGAYIVNMTTTGGNSCAVCIYAGDAAGILTLTDTVNNTSQTIAVVGYIPLRPTTGKTWHILGGIPNPPAPTVNAVGSAGSSTTYYYQIIAINSAGKTQGFPTYSATLGNMGGGLVDLVGPHIGTINVGAATLTSIAYNAISWNAIPGATGYDVLQSTDGSTWKSVSLNQPGTAFNDQGGTPQTYSLPTANTTALGSDSNAGTSAGIGNAFATLSKAASVATAGDSISIDDPGTGLINFVVDSTYVFVPSGVNLYGAGKFKSILNNTYVTTGTHVCYILPTNADVSDLSFTTDVAAQQVVGAQSGDVGPTGTHVYRCDFAGFTNAWRNTVDFVGMDFTDCRFISLHGTMGIQGGTNCSVNFSRCQFYATGGVYTQGTATTPITMNKGFGCFRDCYFYAGHDSQNIPSWQGIAFSSVVNFVRGFTIINGDPFGATTDVSLANTGTLVGVWLKNVSYDPIKNATLATYGPTTASPYGVYLPDPVLSSGTLPNSTTLTITSDGTTPVPSANCWITSDSAGATPITGVLATNGSGQVTFNLTTGTTYYFWGEAPNYRAAGVSFVA